MARRPLRRVVQGAALALLAPLARTWAMPGCQLSSTSSSAPPDRGHTFGLEVTVTVKGRGRVVPDPAALLLQDPSLLDCPSHCFARVFLASREVDGSDEGLVLFAEA